MSTEATVIEDENLNSVVRLLGGKKVLGRQLRSPLDAHDLITRGLPVEAVLHLAEKVLLLREESAVKRILGMSVRTLQRRRDAPKPLSEVLGSRTWKFAEILAHAIRVFGSQSEAERWMSTQVRALGQRRPIDLVATPAGVEMVDRFLTQLEYGVYV